MHYVFGDCTLDTARHELRRVGVVVPLERKVYQVLAYLLAHAERLVPKAELLEAVWPEVYLNDKAVARCIGLARKAVGDTASALRMIVTRHGQGYRVVVPVVCQEAAPPSPATEILRPGPAAADPTYRLEAHDVLGETLFCLGDYATARTHLEQGIALTDPAMQRTLVLRRGLAPGVMCLAYVANALWCLGSPEQALRRSQEALLQAQELAHLYSLAVTQFRVAWLHYYRREVSAVQAQADALLTLATAQEFPLVVELSTCLRGLAQALQGLGEAGLALLRQGLATVTATGQELFRPLCLVLLAEAAGHVGQVEDGLRLLAEALTVVEACGRSDLLAEAYRLQGTLGLHQSIPDARRAEAAFQHVLTTARLQQAKSWELRAALSLSRLWQHQGKRAEAHALLAPIYGWFTEGFDTPDLREAQMLLQEL
jgi:DNA-binding winged helix-turn-helix (wHTH) protein